MDGAERDRVRGIPAATSRVPPVGWPGSGSGGPWTGRGHNAARPRHDVRTLTLESSEFRDGGRTLNPPLLSSYWRRPAPRLYYRPLYLPTGVQFRASSGKTAPF